jgi:LasA protease
MLSKRMLLLLFLVMLMLSGCYQPGPGAKPWQASWIEDEEAYGVLPEVNVTDPPEVHLPQITEPTPTPNPPITLPTPRSETVTYVVQPGDSLRRIAQQYQVSIAQIVTFNEISNPDLISVGQELQIPPPVFDVVAPAFKILPDSELINSPSNAGFDVGAFVREQGGYLASYSEDVDGVTLSGAEIVARVALEYSINPRLLLTALEFQSQWVTSSEPRQKRHAIFPCVIMMPGGMVCISSWGGQPTCSMRVIIYGRFRLSAYLDACRFEHHRSGPDDQRRVQQGC